MGLGDRDAETFKAARWEGRRGGRVGEAINRADWSWISHIGQAVRIQGPKLAILFAHLLLKPPHFHSVARSADVKESRRDNLTKMVSLNVFSSLYFVRKSQIALVVLTLKWFMHSSFLRSYIESWTRFILTIDVEMTLFNLQWWQGMNFSYTEDIDIVAPFKWFMCSKWSFYALYNE